MPIITDMNELVLCFITSVVFSQSNLGYLRFTIIPIKCDVSGIIMDNIIKSMDSKRLILNFISNISVPINKTGVVMVRDANILLIKIVFTFIGRDFNMLIFLPSRLMIELVMDVI